MKKSSLFLTLTTLVLAACDATPTTDTSSTPTKFSLVCDNNKTYSGTWLDDDKASIEIDGETFEVKRAVSASGARYASDAFEMWIKGSEAMLTHANKPDEMINCKFKQSIKTHEKIKALAGSIPPR